MISCLESDKHQLESLLSSVFPGKLMLLWTSQYICSVQSLTCVQLLATPWTAAHQASLSITISPSFAQTYVHQVGDAIQPSHPLLSISPPAFLSVNRSNKLTVQVYL